MNNLIISPKGEQNKQEGPEMAFPLFGLMPGATAGAMTAIIQGGMSLRDYFAAQYIAGSQIMFDRDSDEVTVTFKMVAEEAYLIADCMMEERKKGGATK